MSRITVKGIRGVLAAVCCFALAFAVAACGGDDDGGGGGSDSKEGGTTTIGVILPLTGPVAAVGKQYEDGIKSALEYVNQNGGVLDGKLAIEVRDSAGTPTGAAAAVRDLSGKGVPLIIGDGLSNTFLAEVPVLAQAQIPAITPATADATWTEENDQWAFSVGDTSRQTVQANLAYLLDTRGFQKIGMIYETGELGQSFADATLDVLKSDYPDLSLAGQEQFSANQTNVTAQLNRLRNAGVDGLLVWTFGPGMVKVFQGLDEMGWNVEGATVLGLNDQAVLKSAPKSTLANFAGSNVAMTYLVEKAGDPMSPQAEKFFKAFDAYTGQTTYDGTQLQGIPMFDAVLLAQQAINAAGSADAKKIHEVLESGKSFDLTRGERVYSKDDHVGQSPDAIGLFQGGEPCANVCVAAEGVLK